MWATQLSSVNGISGSRGLIFKIVNYQSIISFLTNCFRGGPMDLPALAQPISLRLRHRLGGAPTLRSRRSYECPNANCQIGVVPIPKCQSFLSHERMIP